MKMAAILGIIVSILSIIVPIYGILVPYTFKHMAILDYNGQFVLYWTPEEERLIMEVQVATLGYIGLGFSDDGSMTGADVVIGWVDQYGQTHLQDRYAFGQLTPSLDTSQDYEILGGAENDTHTTIRFARPWITCDSTHDYQLSGDTVRVLWSFYRSDPSVDPLNPSARLPKHDYRGSRSLYLMDPSIPKDHINNDLLYWDVLAPQVQLPSDIPTLYWCKLYKIPEITKKAHIVGYVPQISTEGPPHVHHMLLYECHIKQSHRHMNKFVDAQGAQCYDQNMPYSWHACGTPIVIWAVGSEGEMYPKNVGLPLGEEHGGGTYFMLEIHYDNPKLRNIVDNSGLRIFYTYELREYDAGILTLGHMLSPKLIVPPGRKWTTVAYCTAECTQKTIPPSGIRAFLGFLHMHLLGASISVQHIRNGRELPTIMKDFNYDFNYQQARVLGEILILPGDSLIVNCGYDATKKRVPTFGGFSTSEEMCLAFLTYYPRVNLSSCYSTPDLALILHTLGIHDLHNNSLSAFGHPYFKDDMVNESYEVEQLNEMEGTEKTPLDITLANIYRLVTVTQPKKYFNRTLYDILYDPATWSDLSLVSTLQEMIKYEQYEPACEMHGRREVKIAPKAKYPAYIALRDEPTQCIPSTTTVKPPRVTTTKDLGDSETIPYAPVEENEIDKESLTQKENNTSKNSIIHYLLSVIILILYYL